MPRDDERWLPSSPTSALSATHGGAFLVRDIDELDDTTLKKLLVLVERARKQRHVVVVIGVMTAYPLLSLFAVLPPLAIPVVVLGGLVGLSTSRLVKRGIEREASSLGIDPNVVRTVEREARRVSSRIPRWITGSARIEALRVQMRALIDDRPVEDNPLKFATVGDKRLGVRNNER